MQIRPALISDADEIVHMIQEFAESVGSANTVSVKKEDLIRDGWKETSTFYCFIADTDDKRAAGYVFVTDGYTSWEGGRALHIEDIFVRPGYRGKGIGTLLLKHVVRLARELKARRVSLLVRHTNESTRLYRRLGFCSGDELEYFYMGEGTMQGFAEG